MHTEHGSLRVSCSGRPEMAARKKAAAAEAVLTARLWSSSSCSASCCAAAARSRSRAASSRRRVAAATVASISILRRSSAWREERGYAVLGLRQSVVAARQEGRGTSPSLRGGADPLEGEPQFVAGLSRHSRAVSTAWIIGQSHYFDTLSSDLDEPAFSK